MDDSKEVPMDVGDDNIVMDDEPSTSKSSEQTTDSKKISETKVDEDAKVQNSKSPSPTKKAKPEPEKADPLCNVPQSDQDETKSDVTSSIQDQGTESESAVDEPKTDDTNSIQEETKPKSEEANVASSIQVEEAKSGVPKPISIQGEEQSDSAKTDPKEASASKTSGKLSTSDQHQVESMNKLN